MIKEVPGEIIECGVFKGASYLRFSMFREIFGNPYSKKIIGFDTFGKFPETSYHEDKKARTQFIDSAGSDSISKEQLLKILEYKKLNRHLDLIEGDITQTIPAYVKANPELKISLLNLDTDIYEPAVTILENLYPKITKGGILMLDDYGTHPGETKAVDEFFQDKNIEIKKFSFAMTPCYIIKP